MSKKEIDEQVMASIREQQLHLVLFYREVLEQAKVNVVESLRRSNGAEKQ